MSSMMISRLLIAATFSSVSMYGQAAALPSFEVASFKFVTSDGVPRSASFLPMKSGSRFSWTTTLLPMVAYAYSLPSWQVRGSLPSGFYCIEALAGESATNEAVRLMTQRLLRDRLNLVAHREKVSVGGFALVVDSHGHRLQTASGPLPEYLKGKNPAAFEGDAFVGGEGKNISAITGRGVEISRLVSLVSGVLRAPVVDRTGLTGKYYFGFKYRDEVPDADLGFPSLFSAIRDALGLRLVGEKTDIEVLVVDHVEKMPAQD